MSKLAPFVFTSLVLHLCAFFTVSALGPLKPQIAGMSDGDPDSVFVTVVSEQNTTPVATAPSSVDSPEAAEARPEQKREEEEPIPPFLAEETQTPSPDLISEEPQDVPPPEKPVTKVHVEEMAKQEESSASTPHTASDAYRQRSAVGSELRDFYSVMLSVIRQSTFYPREALKDRHHGEVVVGFALTTEGTLLRVDIVRASGSAHLDEAAKEIIRKAAAEFPRPPSWMEPQNLNFTIPIFFKEKKEKGISMN